MSECENKTACIWPNCECNQDIAPTGVQYLRDEDYIDDLEEEEIEDGDIPGTEEDAESASRSIDRENAREINRRYG